MKQNKWKLNKVWKQDTDFVVIYGSVLPHLLPWSEFYNQKS